MTTYLLTGNKESCCGCTACESICHKNAITMQADDEGFLHPVLNKTLCVECGLCSKVCPYDKEPELLEPMAVYAACDRDSQSLLKSSSGGIFGVLAQSIVDEGGLVCGVIFDENLKAVHILSNKKEDLDKMRGSKYVQSDLKRVFNEIEIALKSGKKVIFTGTPCQVDGLKGFLRQDYDKLYTVDLICHGVPSPMLLREYICNKSEKGIVTDIKFRNKALYGWGSRGCITQGNNQKAVTQKITPFSDSYYNLYYLMNCVSRNCCYTCQYATHKRVSDITIGDYWNVDSIMNEEEYKNGMSVVLVNTEKGNRLFDEVKKSLWIKPAELSHAIEGNGNLKEPSAKPSTRETIYKDLNEKGFSYLVKNYCKFSYFIPFIKRHIPKGLKRSLKKIMG